MVSEEIGEQTPGETDEEARRWAMLCHLSGLAGYMGIPIGNIVGPLTVWLMKKDQYRIVDKQGKDSLNFQITIFVSWVISALLAFVVVGIFLFFIMYFLGLISTIKASIRTSNGVPYRYPIAIRFVK